MSRAVPTRHWRSYGDAPFAHSGRSYRRAVRGIPVVVPAHHLRRCGKDRMLNEVHAPDRQRDMPIRVLLARARHEGCGGRAGRAELLTGIEGVSSRPVRKIALITNPMLEAAPYRRR
jgi:hypothetical protein